MSNDDEDTHYARVQEASAALRRLILDWRIPLGSVSGKGDPFQQHFSKRDVPDAPRRIMDRRQGGGSGPATLPRNDRWREASVRYSRDRAGTVCGLGPGGGNREGVFKTISWLKSASSVRRAVEYIIRSDLPNRLEPSFPLTGWHECRPGLALPLRSVESIEQALETWNLLSDAENLSPKAKSAEESERSMMAPKERLRHRQALHCIFSSVVTSPGDRVRFVEAAREGLRDIFVANGHRVIWAVHADTKRIHVHLVVQARQSESLVRDGARPKRLQFGWRTADVIRHEFVRRMRKNGLDLTATLRGDRDRTREAIANSNEELRRSRPNGFHAGSAKLIRNLEIFAPQWVSRYLPAYEQRRATHVAARMEHLTMARTAWKRTIATARSWDDLETVLGEEGWQLVISPKPRRRMTLESGAIRYPIRALDRSTGFEKLERVMGEKYERWRNRKMSKARQATNELPMKSIWSLFRRSEKTKAVPIDAIVERPVIVSRTVEATSRNEAYATVRKICENIFINAETGFQSYGDLRAELAEHGRRHLTYGDKVRTRRLETFADWLLIHRPEFFGKIDCTSQRHVSAENFKKLLVLADCGPGNGAAGQRYDQDYVRRSIQQARNLRRGIEEKRRYERWVREVNRMVLSLRKLADSIDRVDPGDPATTRMSKAIVDIARVTAHRAIGVAEAKESDAPGAEVHTYPHSVSPSYASLLVRPTVKTQTTMPDGHSQSGDVVPER